MSPVSRPSGSASSAGRATKPTGRRRPVAPRSSTALNRPAGIVPVSDDQQWINILIHGDPGVGKTVLAGTSPNCLILEADDGAESAAMFKSKADKWRMSDWRDMEEAYEYLRHEKHGYEWVWLDSITLFQERGLDNIMADLVVRKPHRSIYLPDKGEYGENMRRMGLWVRDMKALPFNFGINAHSMRFEDPDDEDKVTYVPMIQGRNMPEKVCGYMGVVAYMYAITKEGKQERHLITRKTAKYYARDRFDALGAKLINPTIPKIQELIAKRKAA